MSLHTRLIESATQAPGEFADIATHDPLSAVLLGIGALLVFLPMAVFGVLGIGVLAELLNPATGSPPQQQAR
jgi:hypothetical protein